MAPGGIAYWLSGALALVAAGSSLLTFLVTGVLRGTAVMNGSARGTALVVLLVGVPVLAGSMWLASRGSAAAVLTWLGAAAYLLYNSLMFAFATPFNRLFLLYLAMLSLSAWSIAGIVWQAGVRALGRRFSPRVPVRGIACYVWVIVGLNSAAWLTRIGPALAHGGPPAFLRGTGLTTNVVYVQDLAWWLPLMAVAGAWLWGRRPPGFLIAGAGLVMWVIESLTIAIDQWYGHAADPASPVASAALVPAFAALALIGLVPVYYLLRGFRGGTLSAAGLSVPVAGRRTWAALVLACLALCTGASAVVGGAELVRNGFGMPLSWLSQTPISGWALPGLALLIGVAVPQLVVLALILGSNRWGLGAGYLAGGLLVAWILVQLLVLQRFFFLQPVIAGIGVLEILFAWLWQHGRRGAGPGGMSGAH
jgi:hypothetical protein